MQDKSIKVSLMRQLIHALENRKESDLIILHDEEARPHKESCIRRAPRPDRQ